MAHAEGWIEAYEVLEEGRELRGELRRMVLSNRNGLGETMLHWYAIEGESQVVEKLIRLGFDVNTTNKFGQTPLFDCVTIERWEIAELLLANGARTDIRDQNEEDVFEQLLDLGEDAKIGKLKELASKRGE